MKGWTGDEDVKPRCMRAVTSDSICTYVGSVVNNIIWPAYCAGKPSEYSPSQ